ncbi:sugar dehydrogenase complex small subunit [Hoeflea sp. YIM 152468]|uniref:sugar dehydrogenase complex small subunit n=1 Tax=Hoeflea sp. YIM 152468 TaxID=3031759 RepID=UPI0023DAB47D|nr:sugar dehydrogenase complex small subunit [Hoeflea sp. YIM 152468]MDF1609200.1 sugar dehydrogenase complex small subunit [Hoeflea sp. YIM 152468]
MTRPKSAPLLSATRRSVLTGGTALAVSGFAPWPGKAFAATVDIDDFLDLSIKLTGNPDLAAEDAAKMLQAFKSIGKAEELAALVEGNANPDLSNGIVAAWYSGVSPDPESNEVITYTEALMWPAMSYSKPMGYCGGATGYWADPPAS